MMRLSSCGSPAFWMVAVMDEMQECTYHDGIVCDVCAAAQIEQSMTTVSNPLLSEEEVKDLTSEITGWLKALVK